MKEQPRPNRFTFLKDALQFELKLRQEGREFSGWPPMSFIEKTLHIIRLLRSRETMKDLVVTFSSANYGAHLLNSVFPVYENPEAFHSRNGVTHLDEHPVQVMGSKEYEAQIAQGVEQGLYRDAILAGFNRQASERGIDLEFSFHATVPPSTFVGLPEPGSE